MSALPHSTASGFLAGLETGTFVSPGAKGWEQAQKQYQAYRASAAGLKPEQLALGLTLLELRKRTPSGLWGSTLLQYGIAAHTSKRAIKAAGMHLGIGRADMAAILCCSLAKLKAYGLQKSGQTPDRMVQVSHSPEFDVGIEEGDEDEVDESKYAVMLRDMVPAGGKREQGSAKVDTTEVRAGGAGGQQPPAFAEQVQEGPRLRLTEQVGLGRRADVEGQMSLAEVYSGATSRIARAAFLVGDRSERAAALTAEYNAAMDEILGEAA